MPEQTYMYAAAILLGSLVSILGFFAIEAYTMYKRWQNYNRLQRLLDMENEARKLQR